MMIAGYGTDYFYEPIIPMNPLLPYRLVTRLLLPLVLLKLWWRGRSQPAYRLHWRERLGHYPIQPNRPLIWIHAVSVGETRAATTLIRGLLERFPDHQILLTHMTPTGRETTLDLPSGRLLRAYLPYDHPVAVERFLNHFEPRIGLLMETELWPTLVDACRRSGCPLLLVNARLSERSAERYGRYPRLIRQTLQRLELIVAQTPEDAHRFEALGAFSPQVMGNLKFDAAPRTAKEALRLSLLDQIGARVSWVAASTRAGEEALILDAWQRLRSRDALLILIPRHPQRFNEVAGLLDERRIEYVRRSENRAVPRTTGVLLGDSMGELPLFYVVSQFALIGGSLLPFGGQNLLEALACGCPVLLGPYTYNFGEATRGAVNAGAARQLEDVGDLTAVLDDLIRNPVECEAMGARGRQFVEHHRGATQMLLTLIDPYLSQASL